MKQKIKVGDIYKDCSYHPVRCTKSDGDDVEGVSLIDSSSPRSCSIINCEVEKITKKESKQLIKAFNKDGESGLLRLNGWPEEAIGSFMEKYR